MELKLKIGMFSCMSASVCPSMCIYVIINLPAIFFIYLIFFLNNFQCASKCRAQAGLVYSKFLFFFISFNKLFKHHKYLEIMNVWMESGEGVVREETRFNMGMEKIEIKLK